MLMYHKTFVLLLMLFLLQCIVLTEANLQTQLTVNAFCRSHTPVIKVHFIFVSIDLYKLQV